MAKLRARSSVVVLLALAAACSGSDGELGAVDAGVSDAGDATTPDAGTDATVDLDAGTADTGTPVDAGADAALTDGEGPDSSDADAGDGGKRFTITLGPPTVVSTHAQRADLGFRFGYVDGVLGAYNRGDAGYVFFVSGHSEPPEAGTCAGTPNTQGAYRIGTAPDVITDNFGCEALIANSGDVVPDGGVIGAYDRDYVGGGPVLSLTNGTSHALALFYHAEFHWGPTCAGGAPCFYGSLGLAISTDGGATFTKYGEIVQPAVSRPDWVDSHPDASLSIGAGPFVLGDADGHPADPATADPTTTYVYVFFDDFDSTNAAPCANAQCLTVARAKVQDLVDAAFGAGGAKPASALFSKYHAGVGDGFQSPAASGSANDSVAGGHSTYVLPDAFEASVLYDRPIGRFLLAYKSGSASPIQLRTSTSVLTWPAAQLVTDTVDDDAGVRYPSFMGELPNAEVGATEPYLFYTRGLSNWSESTFMSRRVIVTP